MIHSVRFIAVLDTNVIYPIIIRDVLFWFAHYDLYTPKKWKRKSVEMNLAHAVVGRNIKNVVCENKK